MATWDDVHRLASGLPGVTGGGDDRAWRYGSKPAFAWERPLRKRDVADLERDGVEVPADPPLAVRTADEGEKLDLLASDPGVFWTIPHFDGYPAVFVHLDRIGEDELAELLDTAWRTRAPKKVAAAQPPPGRSGR